MIIKKYLKLREKLEKKTGHFYLLLMKNLWNLLENNKNEIVDIWLKSRIEQEQRVKWSNPSVFTSFIIIFGKEFLFLLESFSL